jgi:hypothetical protein
MPDQRKSGPIFANFDSARANTALEIAAARNNGGRPHTSGAGHSARQILGKIGPTGKA